MSETIRYIFLLSLLVIAAAYAVGVATDAKAFTGFFTQIIYSAQGRNQQGQFAAYPGNAPVSYKS